MKKLYIFLFIIPFFSSAQSTWSTSSTGYNTSLGVQGITIADNGDAYASAAEFTSVPSVLYTHKLYKSINAGTSWSEVTSTGLPAPDDNPITTCLYSKGTLLLMGYNASIYKSVNSGATWTVTGYNTTYMPQSIAVDGSNTIFATTVYFNVGSGTYNILLYSSVDAGANWTAVTTTGLPESMTAVIAARGTTMYIGTSSGIYKSTNGGATWTISSTGYDTNLTVQSLVINENDKVFASAVIFIPDVPYTVKIYESNDAGANWSELTTTGLTESMSAILAVKGGSMFVGLGNGIYKATDYTLILSVSNNQENQSLAFYPNPADQLITVIALTKRVEFYNAVGKNFLSEVLNGSTVDVSNLEKGLYLIKGFDVNNQLLFSEKIIVKRD